jgi:hypothetical protein
MRVPGFWARTGLPSAPLRVWSAEECKVTAAHHNFTAAGSLMRSCSLAQQHRRAASRPQVPLSSRCAASSSKGLASAPGMRAALYAAASRLYRRCSSRPAAVRVAGAPGLPRCFLACLSSRVAARIRASTDARLLLDPRKMAPRRHELAVIEPFNVLA